jgi:hypothetical protein
LHQQMAARVQKWETWASSPGSISCNEGWHSWGQSNNRLYLYPLDSDEMFWSDFPMSLSKHLPDLGNCLMVVWILNAWTPFFMQVCTNVVLSWYLSCTKIFLPISTKQVL